MNFINTEPKIATCRRCNGYVFTCHVAGIETVVDIQPLTDTVFIASLSAGRIIYDAVSLTTGRIAELIQRNNRSVFGKRRMFGQHTCAGRATSNTIGVEALDFPTKVPVSFGDISPSFVEVPKQEAAKDAIRALSENEDTWKPAVCTKCRTFFTEDDTWSGYFISPSQWWAYHANGCVASKPNQSLAIRKNQ